jgi:glycosyltransferase involved in cell wall biosynthesis
MKVLLFAKYTKYNVEEILIVDSSRDRTPIIIDQIAKIYKIIRHIYFKERKNVNEAFNILVEKCKGDVFIWLNADIDFDPKELDKLIDALINRDDVAVVSPRFCPTKRSFSTLIGRAMCFGVKLTDRLRSAGQWILIGRAFAAKRKYFTFKIPKHLLDPDSFIFFKVREYGLKSIYYPEVCIYFTVPLSWRDFIIENARFEIGQQQLVNKYPEWKYIYNYWRTPTGLFMKLFIKTLIEDPIDGIIWILLKISYRLLENFLLKIYDITYPAESTKVID